MSATHWLTAAEAAADLRYTPKTIRVWCIESQKAVEAGRPEEAVFPNARKYPDDKPRSEWRIPETDLHEVKDRRAVQRGRILTSKERAALMNKYAAA